MKCALIGYGAMGKLVKEELGNECVVCIAPSSPDFMANLFEYSDRIDVIIDFSNPANLNMIIDYAKLNHTNVVIGTTGYTKEQEMQILELSKSVAVIKSSNFSLGAILMNRILKEITPYLANDYDIEFVEKHSAKKNDDPSRTFEMLLDTINSSKELKVSFGRSGRGKREQNEIGVHSIRGGNVSPEREVMFLGEYETLSIKHQSLSREQYAKGAVDAAYWIKDKDKGMYTMDDVVFENKK